MQLGEIQKLDKQHFLNVFGERSPVAFVRAEGCTLIDSEGKKYTDFLAGIAVNALGYSDQGLKKTLHDQIDAVTHTSNIFYVEPQAKAAQLLCEATGLDKVFFSNSGAEAVEGAMKLARKYFFNKGQDKWQIVTMKNSFHGRTLATLTATGQPHYSEAFPHLAIGCKYVPYADIDALRAAISDDVCAVMLEPVEGEGGVIPAGGEFLHAVRALCDEKGILMITDEIQCGMGRTGSFLCTQKYGVTPDIVTLAKALGGGIPVGAFAAKAEVASAFVPGDHGSTFGGNHLATAAAGYMIKALSDPDMLKQVSDTGAYFMQKLQELHSSYPQKTYEPRGEGLLLALPLKAPLTAKASARALLQKGFTVATAEGNCLRFLPPYIIKTTDIDALCGAVAVILEEN